jgi:hypothetical protein
MVSSMEKIMKFRFFVLMLVIVAVTNVFGIDYTNEEYGIHFVLPDNWEITDYENLSIKTQQMLIRKYKPSQTLAVCGVKSPNGLNRTTMIIQYLDFTTIELRNAKKELQSEHGRKMMITLAKLLAGDSIGKKLKSYHIVNSDSDFDNDSNIASGKIYYQDRDKSDFVAMVSKLIVKDGIVTLQSFALGTDVDAFEETIGEIIDSFQYDGSSTVVKNEMSEEDASRLSREQTADNLWEWAGIILTILIVLGVIKLLLFR